MITCGDIADCIDHEYCNFCPAKPWMWSTYNNIKENKNMIYTADDYMNIINQEIEWCKNNKDKDIIFEDKILNKIYQDGFIMGLKQAMILIEQTKILR